VWQYAPAGGNTDAVLTFEFESGGSGPNSEDWPLIFGAYSFLLEGNVSAGGRVGFHFSATWFGETEFGAPPDWHFPDWHVEDRIDYEKDVVVDWECTDPGPFSVRLQDMFYLGTMPPYPAWGNSWGYGHECSINGTMQFTAHNNGGPNAIGLREMDLGLDVVPEPSALVAILTGALGLIVWARCRRGAA
jgi:hypothetical protein